jgi:ornithine cyclodeaminase/alanine dehydrogenase-like protein (mu-crystallin family)
MVFLIRDSDVAQLELTPSDVIEAVEDAYRQDGQGKAEDTPRLEIKIKGKHLPHIAPGVTSVGQGMAHLEGSGVFVITHSIRFDYSKYINQILDPDTGETLAVILRSSRTRVPSPGNMDVGGLRTGAAAAIGAKYLGRKKVEAVGVIGTGRIGRASLICVSEVRDFDKVYSHSGRRRDEEFPKLMEKMLDVEVIMCDDPGEVVRNSDLIVTATYALEPVVKGEWLREGTHISGMGADGPLKSELDTEVFRRAGKVVVDSEKCLSIGEIVNSFKAGALSRESIHGRIGEVVAGIKPGRENDSEITVFESDGTHLQSAAVANLIYRKALETGHGVDTSNISSFFVNP